nr:glycoside hydrolase family 38 C-terminal domain-containing protein [Candidatus Sigynarchaeum springense]
MVNIPDKDLFLCIVSHTHWDREWYLPFEGFRFKLVYTIDKLLKILDNDPRFANFTLDGQAVVLEDYLEIRPQNRPKLERYLKEGRISAGPFYILPDEFKISPEAHVRNLLLGKQVVESFGVKPMPVGNLPDDFGHIAQMPQILQGFNIDNFIFTRGLGDEVDTLNTEFDWIAPDGKTSVLAINQPLGYGNMANATRDRPISAAIEQAKHVRDKLKKRAATNVLLLMSGVDHLSPEEHLPDLVEQFNALGTEGFMKHVTFMAYLDAFRAALKGTKLKTFTGPMQGGREHLLLEDIVTCRIYLLQENLKNEALLERWAEPFSVLAELATRKAFSYPKDYLWHAWRYLIKNHPHDSIGGCSIDAVHRDMVNRFMHVSQLGGILLRDAVRHLVPRIDFYPGKGEPKAAADVFELLVFSPSPTARSGIVHFWVQTAELGEDKCPEVFQVIDGDGKVLHVENWREPDIKKVFPYWKPFDAFYKFEFEARDVPGLGYKTFYVRPTDDAPPAVDTSWVKVTRGETTAIETPLHAIKINQNGTFDLTDKTLGHELKGCCLFIDEPDFGDEYDFVPLPEKHEIITTGKARASVKAIDIHERRATAAISVPFRIPASLTPDRKARSGEMVDLDIDMFVTLHKGSRRVDIKIAINNVAKDHRLRIGVPSQISTASKIVQQHFCVLEKPLKIPEGKNWVQKPQATDFHDHFFAVTGTRGDKAAGLAIITRDVQQHEVNEHDFGQTSMITTLFRAVGWLGRPNQGAGPDVATPDAQCLIPMEFNLALLPFEPCKASTGHFCIPDEVFASVEAFVHPIVPCVLHTFNDPRNTEPLPAVLDYKRFDFPHVLLVDEHNDQFLAQPKTLPPAAGFVSLEPPCLVLSAFKKAEAGDGYILRFYNLCRDDRDARVVLHPALGITAANEVKLDEITAVKNHVVSIENGVVTVNKIGHDEIVTLKLVA